ncbi:hypothetical protein ES703_115414 [subsurface metagenome]
MGRVAALEIMIATPAVRNLIRERKTFQIPSAIQTGKKYGMQSLDDSIMEHLNKKRISAEEAYAKCNDKAKFLPFLKKPPTDFTKTLLTEGSCDLSYQLAGKARFRVNVFSQKGYYSVVMRQLATRVPTIEEMKLPQAFYKMTEVLNGIILVTGATGSGKTTSLAAFLNEINEKRSAHVVTLEDPVEYIHSQKTATFNQREMGTDFSSGILNAAPHESHVTSITHSPVLFRYCIVRPRMDHHIVFPYSLSTSSPFIDVVFSPLAALMESIDLPTAALCDA